VVLNSTSATSDDNAVVTPSALRALGALQVASIVEKALEFFPNHQPPRNRAKREEQMESWGSDERDSLALLDQAFLAYPEPLAQLERAYVRKHEELFLVPPAAGQSVRAI